MTARDVLEKWLARYSFPKGRSDSLMRDLAAAGYSIVHESEIHGATKRRIAEEADAFADQHDTAAIQATVVEAISRFRGGETALRRFADSVRALPDGGVE
ncbi:hypothetical protein [Mesorhizobium sp. Pch-S]|uniref:hypothetical protein n=1 Tax=Mesorhizobium sp. Pch-S TaxID=2082387 RepID=UPI0010108F38|nr:hypothetical protein [Mesorhizobium sp. Pch-S]QAZ46803.1 hypothetical protein C1M53_31620 [Mesorhizobium sp. Pch-S]